MAARKFGRNYELLVQSADGTTVRIEPPFTLDFNITRKTLSDANIGSFKIYNLSERVRNLLRKDQDDVGNNKQIIVNAGYGKQLNQVFRGNVYKGFSVRQGTNFITQLECYDGGFAIINSLVDRSFPKGTSQRTIIKSILKTLEASGVDIGYIGDFSGSILRGNSFSGNSVKIVDEMTGGALFIDNEKVNVMKDNEVTNIPTVIINSDSGLLATPTRERQFINLEMIFEPNISIGQRVKIESSTNKSINVLYKVHSIQHAGIISEAISGSVITTLGLHPRNDFKILEQEAG